MPLTENLTALIDKVNENNAYAAVTLNHESLRPALNDDLLRVAAARYLAAGGGEKGHDMAMSASYLSTVPVDLLRAALDDEEGHAIHRQETGMSANAPVGDLELNADLAAALATLCAEYT